MVRTSNTFQLRKQKVILVTGRPFGGLEAKSVTPRTSERAWRSAARSLGPRRSRPKGGFGDGTGRFWLLDVGPLAIAMTGAGNWLF